MTEFEVRLRKFLLVSGFLASLLAVGNFYSPLKWFPGIDYVSLVWGCMYIETDRCQSILMKN